MIHGVPEVTSRLRSKVENFAIYSALFLGTAIAGLSAPADKIASCGGDLGCEVRKRIFVYCLIVGAVCQMLCIMLAMSFGNALNEAARDCDVFRMFSPAGNGFYATRKCEVSYQIGVGLTFVATLAAVEAYIGPEMLIVSAVSMAIAGKVYMDTSSALFNSGGIVNYWRKSCSPEDPYDLEFIAHAFEQQAQSFQAVGAANDDLEAPAVAATSPNSIEAQGGLSKAFVSAATPRDALSLPDAGTRNGGLGQGENPRTCMSKNRNCLG